MRKAARKSPSKVKDSPPNYSGLSFLIELALFMQHGR